MTCKWGQSDLFTAWRWQSKGQYLPVAIYLSLQTIPYLMRILQRGPSGVIKKLVADGTIRSERIDEFYRRIMRLKKKLKR